MDKDLLATNQYKKYIIYRQEPKDGYFIKYHGYKHDSDKLTDLTLLLVSQMFASGIEADAIREAVDMVIKMYEKHHLNKSQSSTSEVSPHE